MSACLLQQTSQSRLLQQLGVCGMQKCNMTQLSKDDSLLHMQGKLASQTLLYKHKIKQKYGCKVLCMQSTC